jgi:DNA-binding XRE family transcriptional regulator
VGYRLMMSGEIHDWLADLHSTDPSTAMQVVQALAALISDGASLGPPLVVPVAETWPEDLAGALDASYQGRLDRLQVVRKRAAEAAWLVQDLQDQVDELESARARLEDRRQGREAARDQYREAVLLSADVLLEARAGQTPEAWAHGYEDPRSLAEEFFPGQAAEVDAGASALVARNRARTLAEQRTRLGLTQTEVAERMGIGQDQVAAIERAEPSTTDVRTLVAYVEALGGRLEITAAFGGDRVVLRLQLRPP